MGQEEKNYERELIYSLKEKRDRVSELREQLKEAQDEVKTVEDAVVKYMESRGEDFTRTGTYNGLCVSIDRNSKVHAYVRKDDEGMLHDYLRKVGRGEVIKEKVHHATLNNIVQELEQERTPIPEFINYAYLSTIKLYKGA